MQDKSARADGVRKTSVYLTPRPYVYLHRRADNGAVFYVGVGRGYRARSKRGRNEDWAAVAAACGFSVQILDAFDSVSEAGDAEREVIDLLTSMGVVLANRSAGGEGCGSRMMADWEARAAVQDARAIVEKMGRDRMLREGIARWQEKVLATYTPLQRRGESSSAYSRRLRTWRAETPPPPSEGAGLKRIRGGRGPEITLGPINQIWAQPSPARPPKLLQKG